MIELRTRTMFRTLLIFAAACVVPLFCAAPAGSRLPGQSNVDIFGGYGYLHPMSSDIYGHEYNSLPAGMVTGITGYFNRNFGIQAEYSKFFNDPNYCFSTIQGGPAFRAQIGRLIPFAHVLGGGAQVGPSYQHNGSANNCTWGWAVDAGVGIDYVLPAPALHNRLAIRPIEGDFQYTHVDYGVQSPPGSLTGGLGEIFAYRLSAGLVLRLGDMTPPLPASYGCEAQPVTVYPGDPITVTGSALNLEQNKKQSPTYTWTTTGGRLSRNESGATIATDGLTPGDYTVIGRVSVGDKPTQHAECTASFRITAYEPPTISCSANPASIMPGDSATITSAGRSPQNRPLSYSYGTSAGQISGNGTAGTFSAVGVSPGPVNITCNVVDDKGNSGSAMTTVAVVAPPPPPLPPVPVAKNLCSISFERDRKRPVRVDNEAKGCLDDIALELTRETDTVLVVVGKHDPTEKPDAAAERTLNVKQYLTDEKGIDPNRIEVRTGETKDRTADNVLVPPGATWDTGSSTTFDPTTVRRHGQPYAPAPKNKK
jgi:hypothetical protein